MGNFKVSMIIPIYNVQNYIRDSLLSALNQTFVNIEYILVNDCSKDNSMVIVFDIIENHPRGDNVYIYEHKVNKGLSEARNTGLKKAKGDYIFFLDSDDVITKDCIEIHYNEIIQNHTDYTVANYSLIGTKSIHFSTIKNTGLRSNVLYSFFNREWSVSACNKLYDRMFIDKNGFLFATELLHEDILWSYNLSLKARYITCIQSKTYLYKVRNGSITRGSSTHKKIESLIFILNKIVEDWDIGIIDRDMRYVFLKFIISWRFNTSLLLLNYAGDFVERKKYYNIINGDYLNRFKEIDICTTLLRFPFPFFYFIMKPFYILYKILIRVIPIIILSDIL